MFRLCGPFRVGTIPRTAFESGSDRTGDDCHQLPVELLWDFVKAAAILLRQIPNRNGGLKKRGQGF